MNSGKSDVILAFADKKSNYGSINRKDSRVSYNVYSALAQLWACFGKYMCMINVGIVGSFPILALPFLTSDSFKIKMSKDEVGWLVSIIYITMAIGSLLSALPFVSNRKIPMIFAQMVMTVSWLLTYFANESWQLIMARALGGMSMTLSLPQVQAYIGEVAVPQLRGIFGNLTQTMTIMGQFIMSGLIWLNNWNYAVFISGCFPVLAILYLYFIPESPVMLIKKKNYDKAWSALKQLRGWKWANEVELLKEFRQLQRYCDLNNCCISENTNNQEFQSSIFYIDSEKSEDKLCIKIPNNKETEEQLTNNFLYYSQEKLIDSRIMFNRGILGVDNPTFEVEEHKSDSIMGTIPAVLTSSDANSIIDFKTYDQIHQKKKRQHPELADLGLKSQCMEVVAKDNNEVEESIFCFLLKPEMYKPTLLMIICSFFIVGPGADSILIYMKWYIEDFHSQIDYNILMNLLTGATLFGNLLSVCCVSKIGKRNIILFSTICVGFGYISLSLLYYFKQQEQPVNTWLFSIVLIWIFFMEEFGIRTIYHSLMSEVFPLRGKKVGPMIIVLMLCLNGFLVMHNMPNIISSFGTISVIIFDVILNFVGAIFFYKNLFETEGKTLGEIEETFRRNDNNNSETTCE